MLPRIVAASYLYRNFPTTRGWAEMNRQGSLAQYASEEGSDIQQFMNVRDEAKSIAEGTDTAMRQPEETSSWFAQTADRILKEVDAAETAAGSQPNKEFRSTVTDLKILAGLSRYHAYRLLAGVSYNLYKQTGDLLSFDDAITNEKHAVDAWKQIVFAAGNVYSDNLAFGAHAVGFSRHWKEESQLLERDFELLLAERQKAIAKTGVTQLSPRTPAHEFPALKLQPVAPAKPGRDLEIAVTALAGIKWIHLRYRHVNQTEDYQTVEMSPGAKPGVYTARIPAAFIDPKWDLMYFVEAVDQKGTGRMYPDLESETPYVIVAVSR